MGPTSRLTRLVLAAIVTVALTAGIATPARAFENGRLPAGALASAAQGGCVKLAKPAARAWNAFQAQTGRILPVNGCLSAYRTFAQQVAMRISWCARGACSNAAVPGTSGHGAGIAVDIPAWVRQIVDRGGGKFGWCKVTQTIRGRICWSDAANESWHVRFTAGIYTGRHNMPILVEGSRDVAVRWLRSRIHVHARTRACRVDVRSRRFGPQLRRCVLAFQKRSNLAGDGVVGPAVWKALIR